MPNLSFVLEISSYQHHFRRCYESNPEMLKCASRPLLPRVPSAQPKNLNAPTSSNTRNGVHIGSEPGSYPRTYNIERNLDTPIPMSTIHRPHPLGFPPHTVCSTSWQFGGRIRRHLRIADWIRHGRLAPAPSQTPNRLSAKLMC